MTSPLPEGGNILTETTENNSTPVLREKIGEITYVTELYFKTSDAETLQTKLNRMIQHDIQNGELNRMAN